MSTFLVCFREGMRKCSFHLELSFMLLHLHNWTVDPPRKTLFDIMLGRVTMSDCMILLLPFNLRLCDWVYVLYSILCRWLVLFLIILCRHGRLLFFCDHVSCVGIHSTQEMNEHRPSSLPLMLLLECVSLNSRNRKRLSRLLFLHQGKPWSVAYSFHYIMTHDTISFVSKKGIRETKEDTKERSDKEGPLSLPILHQD
jgi:hypothetical protein